MKDKQVLESELLANYLISLAEHKYRALLQPNI